MAFLRLVVVWLAALGETIAARARRGPLRPGWGLTFEWVIRALRRDMVGMSGWSYPRLRKELDWRFYPKGNLRKLRVTREVIAGVSAAWFEPPQLRRGGLILYLHGGSYIFGSVLTTHADLIARLAMESGARTLGIDYRLAPESPYPAAQEDTLAVVEELVRRGTPASEIVLVGDSAGGNLALAVQIALRQRGLGQAQAAALISPWLELNASFASCRVNDAYDYGQTSFLLPHARVFAGELPLDDPRISPLHAELPGLSPLFVQVGSAERLFDEGVELARRAEHAGVSVTLDVARDMPHNPPLLASFHPEAARALDALVQFVSHHLPVPDRVRAARKSPVES
jgi:monoterpene epsilon-lactone hydrolase